MNYDIDSGVLQQMQTQNGEDLHSIIQDQTVLLVFLRHFGCVFCKEALDDLSAKKKVIEDRGVRIIFVHMAKNDVAEEFFNKYGLNDVSHISDPFCRYYVAFGIMKGSFTQLYGLSTWKRGFAASRSGYELQVAKRLGDSSQRPGLFIFRNGEVIERFIHKVPSDRPDYEKIVASCTEEV